MLFDVLQKMRLLTVGCLLLLAACASRPQTYGKLEVSYIEPRELWDDVDRDALKSQRLSTDGFPTPLSCVKAFMNEVFSSNSDRRFLDDERFCAKYFSEALRFQIATSKLQYERRIVKGNQKTSVFPIDSAHAYGAGNKGTILSCWDLPTSYKIGGFHSTTIQGDAGTEEVRVSPRSVVDVVYRWGPGTQHEGNERNTSVILVRESGRWFVQDLYTHEGFFESAGSFYNDLVK